MNKAPNIKRGADAQGGSHGQHAECLSEREALPSSSRTVPTAPTGGPPFDLAELDGLSLAQCIDQLYLDEVKRVISIEIPGWDSGPLAKQAIERALSTDFWSMFDAVHRWPIVSNHDPLDQFQPGEPFDIEAVRVHCEVRRKLDDFRRRCFMQVVHPLIEAISRGELLVFGRLEPVKTRDQSWVELPFSSMQDQQWRLCRGQSRVVIFDAHGAELTTFREARLRSKPVVVEAGVISAINENSAKTFDRIPYKRLALKTWLQHRVTSWLPDKAPPTEKECLIEARTRFSGLSRDEFRRVRAESVLKSWRKRGPRRPSGDQRPPNSPKS